MLWLFLEQWFCFGTVAVLWTLKFYGTLLGRNWVCDVCLQAFLLTSSVWSLLESSLRMAVPWLTTTSRRSLPSIWCCVCVEACRSLSRPWLARPSLWRLSHQTPLTMSRARSKTRRVSSINQDTMCCFNMVFLLSGLLLIWFWQCCTDFAALLWCSYCQVSCWHVEIGLTLYHRAWFIVVL